MTILSDLDQSLCNVEIDGRDLAAVGLARALAAEIDTDPDSLGRLAPKLLASLRELQLTPAARKGVRPDDADDGSEAELAAVLELRPAG